MKGATVAPTSQVRRPSYTQHRIDVSRAIDFLNMDNFPKLKGPSNHRIWRKKFERIAAVGGLWEFFTGGWDHLAEGDGAAQYWLRYNSRLAVAFLEASCTDEAALSIDVDSHPPTALKMLDTANKNMDPVQYPGLMWQWASTSMQTCGSARAFRDRLKDINAELRYLHPDYAKPAWEMNAWFLMNLTEAFDHKVRAFMSDPMVVSPDHPMDFDVLTASFVNEEDRLAQPAAKEAKAVKHQKTLKRARSDVSVIWWRDVKFSCLNAHRKTLCPIRPT